jgi:hypothetical protein
MDSYNNPQHGARYKNKNNAPSKKRVEAAATATTRSKAAATSRSLIMTRRSTASQNFGQPIANKNRREIDPSELPRTSRSIERVVIPRTSKSTKKREKETRSPQIRNVALEGELRASQVRNARSQEKLRDIKRKVVRDEVVEDMDDEVVNDDWSVCQRHVERRRDDDEDEQIYRRERRNKRHDKRRRDYDDEDEKNSSDEEKVHKKKKNKFPKVRDIPKFDGSNMDDYGRWKQETLYFVKCHRIETSEQVEIISLGLSGIARKLIATRTDIQLLFQLFEALEEVFKRSGANVQIALKTRQMPEESVKEFAARFQANWQHAELGQPNDKGIREFKLRIFLDNLKPIYSERLRIWAPRTFSDALDACITYESEESTHRTEKSQTKMIECERFECHSSNDDKRIRKILTLIENRAQSSNNNKTNSLNRTQSKRDWSKVKCFHCGEHGHGYSRCSRASIKEIDAISCRLPEYITRQRVSLGK